MRKVIALFSIFLLFLSACGSNYEGDFSLDVKPFEYTNQDNQTFSSSSLEGKFWVANMIFTNCPSICPPMTRNMARLQDNLAKEDLDVELVSFSIDPDNDTPDKLKQYAKNMGGEFHNWNLLTGYDFEEIKEFSITSFKALVKKIDNSDDMLHSSSFYLISPEGKAIKKYDGRDATQMEVIVKDIQKMM